MPDHIGIVAVSGPGAALCYETICTEASGRLGRHAHPEVSMHAFSFADHVRLIEEGDWHGVGRLMIKSARKLASLGAKFAICPDNTVHQALGTMDEIPIPWLHIADVVAAEAQKRQAKRLAILGTQFLMEGPVYREKLDAAGIEWRVLEATEREAVNRIIFDELVFGRVTEEAKRALGGIIERIGREQSCDAVVLGCTELPLAVTGDVSALPTLDSTRLLARAAIARSIGEG